MQYVDEVIVDSPDRVTAEFADEQAISTTWLIQRVLHAAGSCE